MSISKEFNYMSDDETSYDVNRFSACARMVCRFQSMQTIIFDCLCDSVFSTVVKFQNKAAAYQHSLPVLITDGEKFILLYATFTYIS